MFLHRRSVPAFIAVLTSAHSLFALCFMAGPTYTAQPLQSGNDQKIYIVSVSGFIDPNVQPFTDTVYQSELVSRLKSAYDKCTIAVIARVSKTVAFVPPIDELNKPVFASESVTVSIDHVFKGDIKPFWNFTCQYTNASYRKVIDPETGDTVSQIMQISHSEQKFGNIVNRRFLLFLNREDLPADEKGPFPIPVLGSCVFYSNAYRLNNNNEIFFDGFEIDQNSRKVHALPEMTCPLVEFAATITPEGILSRPGSAVRNERPALPGSIITSYHDLLGRQLPHSHGRFGQTSNGMFIRTTGNHRERTSAIQLK